MDKNIHTRYKGGFKNCGIIMKLTVLRYNSQDDFTQGLLFIDGKFECHTIEDEQRTVKVYSETAIPNGTYEVKLRTEGKFHQNYSSKFPLFHKGMLHVTNVPNFEYILIHIGNDDDDTAGCLLVGRGAGDVELGIHSHCDHNIVCGHGRNRRNMAQPHLEKDLQWERPHEVIRGRCIFI